MANYYGETAGMLADRLRPLVLAACDGEPPDRFGSSCLSGTPMIPIHRATLTAVYGHLERLAAVDGETTQRTREYPGSHGMRSDNLAIAHPTTADHGVDVGESEAVEQIISAWAFAHNIDGAARNDLFKRLCQASPKASQASGSGDGR